MANAQGDNKNMNFYVAKNGNDAWSGKLAAPGKGKTDGPFATLQRASDAIIELKKLQGGKLNQPVNISIREGIYMLDKPLVLTPEHSGTADCPVEFSAYGKEKPVISGGKYIKGWKQVTVNGKKMWSADIPAVREGKWTFEELWVNNQRRFPARYPKKGYLSVEKKYNGLEGIKYETPGQDHFKYMEGDLKAWDTANQGRVVLMSFWIVSRLGIVNVDEKQQTVNCSKPSSCVICPGDLYYVENILELLDSPGEWFLDRKAGKIYYMPANGEDMTKASVIAPALDKVIKMQGKPESNQYVENILFKNLTFSHAESPGQTGFWQGAVIIPGMLYGEGVQNCSFEDCTFAHFGTYAIELARGCNNNSITRCDMHDTGGGGVKIGEQEVRDNVPEQTHGNKITDCKIYDGGLVYHSAIGIIVFQSYNNLISHNLIHDFYYSGMSVGWTWGYGPSLSGGNIVEFNDVHHIGIMSDGDGPILSDMGGIYTLGIQPGSIIRNNLFHDIAGIRYGGWGIYFDEGSSDILAENNAVYNTTHGGLHQHYGKENIVRNNIFAFGRDQQVQHSRQQDHRSFVFWNNIVLWNQGNLFNGPVQYFNEYKDYKFICFTLGINGHENDNPYTPEKHPYAFKKFVLSGGRNESRQPGAIPIAKLKAPVKIDGTLRGFEGIKPIELSDPKIPASDLSAQVYLAWDEQNFYFGAKVQDDFFRNIFTGDNIWLGDSVQIAFDTLNNAVENKGYDNDDYEFGFALTKDGPQVSCWVAPEGKKTGLRNDIKQTVKREGNYIFYEAAIPLKELSPLKPGNEFGFDACVNDNDTKDTDSFDNNLYFNTSGKTAIFNYNDKESVSLDEWRKFGLDIHSIIADPLFVAPEKYDFDLKPGSPAIKLGFKPISIKGVGPRR